MNLNITRSRR